TRMGVLNVWFWSTIIAGGALTIDAPYMCRLIGMVPVDAIFAALIVSKLSAEAVGLAGQRLRMRAFVRGWDVRRMARWSSIGAVAALLAFLTWQNFYDYYDRYLGTYPAGEATGFASFVSQMNDKEIAEGRSKPMYYMCAP